MNTFKENNYFSYSSYDNYFSYFSYDNYFSFDNNEYKYTNNFKINKMNTENIIFNMNISEKNISEWSINDVYNWIIKLNMRRSVLIANAFKEEEIDGETILYIEKTDVEEIFKDHNLGTTGLFWLAIFKLK